MNATLNKLFEIVFTLPYRVWSNIVIVHENRGFFPSFFSKYLKNGSNYFNKKIDQNHGISVYKKGLISEHRKNYIFRDNHCFVKISVSLFVSLFFWASPNFCGRASSKTSVNIKTKFDM